MGKRQFIKWKDVVFMKRSNDFKVFIRQDNRFPDIVNIDLVNINP